MNGDQLFSSAMQFREQLQALKAKLDPAFPWYPYDSLSNFAHLRTMFNAHPLDTLTDKRSPILDIGSADGDMPFFMETLGYKPDIIDFGPTNFNGLRGARKLKEALGSAVNIHEMDIDSQFTVPGQRYDLIVFLGILYHLKNPYYLLEALAKKTKYMLVSTRIAKFAPDGTSMANLPVAYLVDPLEMNNDNTNYWVFSTTGLQRIFKRSGWELVDYKTIGDTENSNPRDGDHDERAFALLKSKVIS